MRFLVYTVNELGVMHIADVIHTDVSDVWTLCGKKFEQPTLELNFGTCSECVERLSMFDEKQDAT